MGRLMLIIPLALLALVFMAQTTSAVRFTVTHDTITATITAGDSPGVVSARLYTSAGVAVGACREVFVAASPETGSEGRILWTGLTASTDYEVRVNGAAGCTGTVLVRTRVTTLPPPTATPTPTATPSVTPTPTPVPELARFEAAVDPDGTLTVLIDGVPDTVATVEWRAESGGWTAVTDGEAQTGATAGQRLHVRARPGPDADWQRLRVTVPVVRVYGARAWLDTVREGDALVLLEVGIDGGGDDEGGDAPDLTHELWWAAAGASAQAPQFFALYPGADGCVGVSCTRPDGQGRGLVAMYHAARPAALEGQEVTVSTPGWSADVESGVTLVVADEDHREGPTLQDILEGALLRIEREWGERLVTGSGTLTEAGVAYVDAVLPNAALYPIHPLYPINRQAIPGNTPTPTPPATPTPGASSLDRAFEQVSEETGVGLELLREVAIAALIVTMVSITPKETDRRRALPLAVIGAIALAISIGWAGALTMQALLVAGIIAIFRRVTREVPV